MLSAHRLAALTHLSGEVVSLYGTSGPSNGPYLAQLDGGQAIQYNASHAYPTNYGVMIYHADNLGSGTHQLLLTNLPGVTGQSLTIDYAQLWTTAEYIAIEFMIHSLLINLYFLQCYRNFGLHKVCSKNLVNAAASLLDHSQLSSGAIAGIAIAAAVAVLSAGVAIFFYRRWKTALATHQDLYRVYTSQRPPPDLATVPPTGVSSSLETRSNASLVRNDPSIQALSGRVQQPANNHAAQYHGAVPVTSGSRNSRSVIDTVSSSSQPPADEVRRFSLVNYSKDVECVHTHRDRNEGLCQKLPEEACHCPTNFRNLGVRDLVRV